MSRQHAIAMPIDIVKPAGSFVQDYRPCRTSTGNRRGWRLGKRPIDDLWRPRPGARVPSIPREMDTGRSTVVLAKTSVIPFQLPGVVNERGGPGPDPGNDLNTKKYATTNDGDPSCSQSKSMTRLSANYRLSSEI